MQIDDGWRFRLAVNLFYKNQFKKEAAYFRRYCPNMIGQKYTIFTKHEQKLVLTTEWTPSQRHRIFLQYRWRENPEFSPSFREYLEWLEERESWEEIEKARESELVLTHDVLTLGCRELVFEEYTRDDRCWKAIKQHLRRIQQHFYPGK